MKIVSFTMVNNESEIIESFVRYNYNFVDEMVIIDNGCTDSTIKIVRNLINEGFKITVYDESLEAYNQYRLDNKYLNKIINEIKPDIILPLDADEFLIGSENPRDILEGLDLNSIYYKLNKKYFGKDVFIDEEIKYEWARIPHFYSDFYVYKYSTGVSAAIAIATKILNKEPGFIDRYIEMLKQGCSKKSIDLLKMVDVDLERKETYCNTIEFYKKYIDELKKCYDL